MAVETTSEFSFFLPLRGASYIVGVTGRTRTVAKRVSIILKLVGFFFYFFAAICAFCNNHNDKWCPEKDSNLQSTT